MASELRLPTQHLLAAWLTSSLSICAELNLVSLQCPVRRSSGLGIEMAYAALKAMAELNRSRGDSARSEAWLRRAERLRAAIEENFWIPEMNFYAVRQSAGFIESGDP